ncbi:SID1 transmembrane family member 2-like isoform X1 [Leptopilina boulardi]|uniref:SID1 transmembrane family member 2-like isoform X1 n=1 Tax=Leptopilina boulardi TaxID=63433 RepID=UPI0021F55541|nr:SID1 transmembrane family member 2-like isoform X1 [Leptopilina boulardi]
MIFSIQNKSCSILDVEKNIKYADLWQTVSHKGAITVSVSIYKFIRKSKNISANNKRKLIFQKNNFPNGFFIVLVGKTDDSNCFEVEPSKMLLSLSKREKFVTLTINSGHVKNDYLFACILYISAILGFVIIYIVSSLLYYKKFKYTKYILNQQDDYTIDLDKVENLITDKKLTKIQVLCVSDLSKKEPVDLSERSRLYMYYLVTVSVFYILPVLQLVTTNQINVEESGNQDICYYNFFCAQPFGFLSSFNNVFSNFGYTLFGILFIIITRLREKYNDINRQTLYGIPQHYGLYYAMGIALVMEGVLSACYHICPSHNNLQFDTSFMYIITVLCMVKLYQIRHPDTHAKAPVTFGVLALIILLALIGVIDSSLPFRIIFTVMHLIFFSYLIAEVYSLGRRRFFGGYFSSFYFSIKYDFHKIREEDYSFFYVLKFMFFLMALASNVSLAIYSSLFYNKNFNMYLLGILMLNLVLYLIFYCFMKVKFFLFTIYQLMKIIVKKYCICFILVLCIREDSTSTINFYNSYDINLVWCFLFLFNAFNIFGS